MHTVQNNHFGGTKPEHKVYHQDLVEINDNIREEYVTVAGKKHVSYIADSTFYTYNEYIALLDQKIEKLIQQNGKT